MVVYLARAPPQVCAPTRHKQQFFSFAGKSGFSVKIFQDPYVPDGCIYRSTVLGREDKVSKVSFDIILSKKNFEKNFKFLQLNPKGKTTLKVDFRVFTYRATKLI